MEIKFSAETPAELFSSIEEFLRYTQPNKIQVAIDAAMTGVHQQSAKEKLALKVAENKKPLMPEYSDDEDIFAPKNSKGVTKNQLRDSLQKILEQGKTDEVIKLFEQFGIKNLDELDHKRYHELMKAVEAKFK